MAYVNELGMLKPEPWEYLSEGYALTGADGFRTNWGAGKAELVDGQVLPVSEVSDADIVGCHIRRVYLPDTKAWYTATTVKERAKCRED